MLRDLLNIPNFWDTLSTEKRTILLYGMGNGADKILRICTKKHIPVSGVFASDDFVRGQTFHGMTVRRWNDMKAQYGAENIVVLMAFASSRPEVLENVLRIATETTLYSPDVPVFGDGLFDSDFFRSHLDEIQTVYDFLGDDESRLILWNVLQYKLTGDIRPLMKAVSKSNPLCPDEWDPGRIRYAADLGAYRGDTVKQLARIAPNLEVVHALEPDQRNYRKLEEYSEQETNFQIHPVFGAAWSSLSEIAIDDSGNRNASVLQNRSEALSDRPTRIRYVRALPLDSVVGDQPLDYIKYDVEGSELEALKGSRVSILRNHPKLLVSVYHRNGDLFELPIWIRREFPFYRSFLLRRSVGIPAWDLNLFCD